MANAIKLNWATSITWTSSGGTELLTLTSLADGNGRAGEEHDFGDPATMTWYWDLKLDFNVAPTAGNVVDIYWAASDDGTDYWGECTGADEAYNSEDDMKRLMHLGSLVCSNDTNPQITGGVFELPGRYGLPVISNQSGQALTATGTDQIFSMTPRDIEVQ